ncbi:hypothetical protein ACFYZ9_31205 [Streptomyces sp. NPDC001691]|uniref:hypothetical protein n=1 Tax=unclassified Streptomyces TaxID=2593676 RepID=UPI0011C05768|nr:hypothetical protein [Streptomyces sp. SDr-06]
MNQHRQGNVQDPATKPADSAAAADLLRDQLAEAIASIRSRGAMLQGRKPASPDESPSTASTQTPPD